MVLIIDLFPSGQREPIDRFIFDDCESCGCRRYLEPSSKSKKKKTGFIRCACPGFLSVGKIQSEHSLICLLSDLDVMP